MNGTKTAARPSRAALARRQHDRMDRIDKLDGLIEECRAIAATIEARADSYDAERRMLLAELAADNHRLATQGE